MCHLKVLKELSNEFERILKAHPPISETSPPGAQAGESGMVQRVDSMVTPCYQCSGGNWRGNKETPQSTNTNTKKHKKKHKTQTQNISTSTWIPWLQLLATSGAD